MHSIPVVHRITPFLFALALLLMLAALSAHAESPRSSADDDAANQAWRRPALAHLKTMHDRYERGASAQQAPAEIPAFDSDYDPSGRIATLQPAGPTVTAGNAFFQDLGTNQRTCFTCHQPQNAWTVSAADVQARFRASQGKDPIFRVVDGANCPSADVTTLARRRAAYSLLLSKGLLRIGLAVPPNAEYKVEVLDDPHGCNTDPETGLNGQGSGIVSVYRRPLPSTNTGFLSAIMWDGRESSLDSQAIDATLGHAQAAAPPSAQQRAQIVAFESGLYTAQWRDHGAGATDRAGAKGGPAPLGQSVRDFFIGINDPLGQNPSGAVFTPRVFTLYDEWTDAKGVHAEERRAIARGQQLFNSVPITITGVRGLNDALGQPRIDGFCGTCHDTPNVGNHSVKLPLDIGVADAGAERPPVLDIDELPTFRLTCTSGPLAGQVYTVTDPGRALISGKCADVGRFKGPILRGLAARAPYFHNGSAATLDDVLRFYEQRFALRLSDQQHSDLVAFLRTL